MAPKKTEKKKAFVGPASWNTFTKRLIRHSPDSKGNFIWVTKAGPSKETGVLKAVRVAQSRSQDTCMLLSKAHQFLNEAGATTSFAAQYLQNIPAGAGMLQYLQDHGADFVAACTYLNKWSETDKDKAKAKDHMEKYFEFLNKLQDPAIAKHFQAAVRDGARIYTLGASILEQTALMTKPEAWKDKLETKRQNAHKEAKKFKKSGDVSDLHAWLIKVAEKSAKSHTPTKNSLLSKRDETAASDSSDSKGSSSSSSSKKKKKNKKSKKDDKKNKKEKKKSDKKEKKDKSSSASGQDSDSDSESKS